MPDNTENNIKASSLSAEIIAVGTELLMGEVVNSNASYLSKALAGVGVDMFYHTVVGDNVKRLKEVFKQALSRSNIILLTGGLGPTDDDLTVSTLADLLEIPLQLDKTSAEHIKQFFITRDMPMSSNNLKQALVPEGSMPLFNRIGTAPGLFWNISDMVAVKRWGEGPRYIFAFPGVPREMIAMWQEIALPHLKTLLPQQFILVTRFLKFAGIGESVLGEKLHDLMASSSPTVSPYVGQAEVKIRIAVKAASKEEGLDRIADVEQEIMNRVGKYCYGKDETSLEETVAEILKTKQLKLSVAESCTGGLVSSRLTDISGSSGYTSLNVVTYSNDAKEKFTGVSSDKLKYYGAVSPEIAKQMAEGVIKVSGSQVGLSLTGIAGPTGGSLEKPVGLVYIGLAGCSEKPVVKKVMVNPQYDRQHIKYWFSQYALNFLRLYLLGLLDPDQ